MTLNGLVLASLGASCGGGGLHLPGPCVTAPEPPPPVVKWEGQCLREKLCQCSVTVIMFCNNVLQQCFCNNVSVHNL